MGPLFPCQSGRLVKPSGVGLRVCLKQRGSKERHAFLYAVLYIVKFEMRWNVHERAQPLLFFVQLISTDLWLFPKIYWCDRRQPGQRLPGI
jgi:hypothetical protein